MMAILEFKIKIRDLSRSELLDERDRIIEAIEPLGYRMLMTTDGTIVLMSQTDPTNPKPLLNEIADHLREIKNHRPDMDVGQKYLITHKSELERLPRKSLLKLMEEREDSYIFDARPIGGNQKFPKSWVINIEPAAKSATMFMNRIIKG